VVILEVTSDLFVNKVVSKGKTWASEKEVTTNFVGVNEPGSFLFMKGACAHHSLSSMDFIRSGKFGEQNIRLPFV